MRRSNAGRDPNDNLSEGGRETAGRERLRGNIRFCCTSPHLVMVFYLESFLTQPQPGLNVVTLFLQIVTLLLTSCNVHVDSRILLPVFQGVRLVITRHFTSRDFPLHPDPNHYSNPNPNTNPDPNRNSAVVVSSNLYSIALQNVQIRQQQLQARSRQYTPTNENGQFFATKLKLYYCCPTFFMNSQTVGVQFYLISA